MDSKDVDNLKVKVNGNLGKGNCRELPWCVVEGIQSEWLEDNKRSMLDSRQSNKIVNWFLVLLTVDVGFCWPFPNSNSLGLGAR